jgi:hypothetical protein
MPEQDQAPAAALSEVHDTPDHGIDAPGSEAPENGLVAPSVLDALRKQYAEADGERRTTLMIVPGRFDARLAARYRPVPWDDQRRKIRQAAKQGDSAEAELNYGAELIAEACEEILIRTADGRPLLPMHTEVAQFKGGEPVRYDQRLCTALGIDGEDLDAKAIVRLVFKNPQALNQHYAELDAFQREAVTGDEEDDADSPT